LVVVASPLSTHY